jgi:hypothetical protein
MRHKAEANATISLLTGLPAHGVSPNASDFDQILWHISELLFIADVFIKAFPLVGFNGEPNTYFGINGKISVTPHVPRARL